MDLTWIKLAFILDFCQCPTFWPPVIVPGGKDEEAASQFERKKKRCLRSESSKETELFKDEKRNGKYLTGIFYNLSITTNFCVDYLLISSLTANPAQGFWRGEGITSSRVFFSSQMIHGWILTACQPVLSDFMPQG